MYILCMIILIFFAIIGICALITSLLDHCYHGDHETTLVLKELSAENAEARIRSAARICQHHKGMRLICICGKDDPAFDICVMMQKEYPLMELCSGKDSDEPSQ